MRPPKRAIEVTIKIGADRPEDVAAALEQIQFAFDDGGPREITSGSPHCGWQTEVEFRPEQSHEKYHRDVKAFLQYARSNR